MILKESNSAEWFKEVKKRVDALEKLVSRKEPVNSVHPDTLRKLVDDTNRSKMAEARELMAASRILWEELASESSRLK